MNVDKSRPKRAFWLRNAALGPWWLLSVPLSLLAGCTFDALPPLPDYAVSGSLRGLWDGATATLTMTSSDGASETVTLTADGEFTFVHRLPSEATYSIELAEPVDRHDCNITNATGTVAAADVTSVVVDCEGPIAVDIRLANPLDVAIDTTLSSQTIPVSLLQQEVKLNVSAPGATNISVDGATVASGFHSMPRPLAVGDNAVHVEVTAGELSRAFELVIVRGQSTSPTEYAYHKASNLEGRDYFGAPIVSLGDMVWVGAWLEDSSTTSGADNAAVDSGAAYLFTRNGDAWEQTAMFKRTFNPGAHFGRSVAVSPSQVFVAAPDEDLGEHQGTGSIYGFVPSASTWLGVNRMVPADPTNVEGFGTGLALDGDVLAVNDRRPGSVHIFRGPDWTEERVIRPAHVVVGDLFGAKMAVKGDTLIVSAYDDDSAGRGVFGTEVPTDNDSIFSGALYIYRSDGGQWNLEAFIKASNADAYDHFGFEVAFDGETLVVSADGESSGTGAQSDNSAQSAGAVYVFRRDNGTWRQEAYLKSPEPRTNHYFGISIDVAGDLIAVGEYTATGTVHLYQRQATGWTWVAALNASNAEERDSFGSHLSLTTTGLVVSAPFEDSDGSGPQNNASPDSGAWYAFR